MAEANDKGQWWAGPNDEWFTEGPFATRDEAIAEGRASFDTGFHICEAAKQGVRLSAKALIESQYFENEDWFNYEYGGEPDRMGACDAADAELQSLLDDWVARHRETFSAPTLFAWSRNQEFISGDAA